MTVVIPGVDILEWSSPVAVDSSPSPDNSNAYQKHASSEDEHLQTKRAHLLIGLAAGREYTVVLVNLVLPPAAWLILEIAIKAMDDVPSTVRGGLRQIRRFQVVYLNLQLCL